MGDVKRYLVDYITDLWRSNDIIYAKDIEDCIAKFKEKYPYKIIRIHDLEYKHIYD